MKLLMPAFSVAVMFAVVAATTFGADTVDGSTASNLPDSRTLLGARPLTAPGSLTRDEYASVLAFLLSYDCAKRAGDGEQPLPTTDLPALQHVTLRATDCAPNQSPH
jgi:hypothetical protein